MINNYINFILDNFSNFFLNNKNIIKNNKKIIFQIISLIIKNCFKLLFLSFDIRFV